MKLAIALLLVPLSLAHPQTAGDTSVADFIARARSGTAAFRNPEAARTAGYRAVGPDFPGMGRHWIHTALILRSTPDPAQPPVLEYAELNGTQTLVGVAYAVLVKGDSLPPSLPVPAEAWHFHQGTVDQESFLRGHAGAQEEHARPGPRLAVLHAWIWLDNPDGLFATDNWALPFARFGLRVPPNASRAAARALALASGDGGRLYLEALLHAVGQPSHEEKNLLSALVGRHQVIARARAPDVAGLEACWNALWDEVQTSVRPEVWERLVAIR
jgi:hypothetical protein